MSGAAAAALILAAGRGTRFGETPKLLAELDGKPLVRHAAEAALASRARPVIAVLGHRREEVSWALHDLDIGTVDNPRHCEGLSTSLQAGFAALPDETEAVVVLLADMPRIEARIVDALIDAWQDHGRPDAVIPTLGGRRGNPVLLSRSLEGEIMRLSGDAGAGPLLRNRSGVMEWPLDDAAILADVDTPEALRALGG